MTNQWYERLSTGKRRFHWTIKNIGTLACGTNVLLSAISADSIKSTGGMEPSEIKTFSVELTAFGDVFEVPLLGLVPSGATSANSCRFKVRRTWYQRVAQGDVAQPVYLRYEVQNTGNIACGADVQMGAVAVESRVSAKTLGAGSSSSTRWNNANPTTATHLIGLDPVQLGCAPARDRLLAAGLQAGNPVRVADEQGCVSAGVLLADHPGFPRPSRPDARPDDGLRPA